MTNKSIGKSTEKAGNRSGLGEFVLVAVLAGIGLWLLLGHVSMEVIGETVPGPLFMPTIVGISSLALAGLLTFDILIKPRRQPFGSDAPSPSSVSPDLLSDLGDLDKDNLAEETGRGRSTVDPGGEVGGASAEHEKTDWKTVILVFLIFAGVVLILPYAGWIITSSLLFFALAQVLGKSSWIFDLSLGFIMGSVTYFLFSVGLGISLPAGLIGGI